jgi:hypothetical protein
MYSLFRYILLSGIVLFSSLRVAAQLAMPDNVCIGAVKHYYVDPNPVPGSTYTWKIDGVTQLSSTTNEIDISWNTPGTYLLEVQELSVDGCYGPVRSGQVFVNPLPTIIVDLIVQPTCTVPTGSVILSGLPPGDWIINPGSISGSGSGTTISNLGIGTYNFTVTDDAGCTSEASSDVVINEQPETPSAPTVSTSTPVNVCPDETINLTTLVTSVTPPGGSILYKTTNDPLGIDITDPTAVETGNYYIFYQNQEGCYSSGTIVTATINPCFKTLDLTSVMLQGLYDSGGTMRQAYDEYGVHWPEGVADHITVELHNATSYSTIAYMVDDVPLSIAGSATVTIPYEFNDSYYITIRSRNHIETTTAAPISLSGSVISYAYDLPSKAYGGNLILIDGHYAIYAGDSNGDGVTDGLDLINVENGATLFSSGYLLIDLNGDGIVDALDLILAENNAFNFVSAILP